MVGGIYKITNVINKKIYIGRTKSFKRRFSHYKYDFENQRKDQINSYLLNSMNKYGFDNFDFEILETCEFNLQPERELYWIKVLNTTDRNIGYNLRLDVEGCMITHPDTSIKISNRLKSEWDSGIRDGHSDKLKKSWENRSREDQSRLMSRTLTKWFYIVNGEEILYQELKNRKLNGAICKFSKTNSDIVKFKGYTIERKRFNES